MPLAGPSSVILALALGHGAMAALVLRTKRAGQLPGAMPLPPAILPGDQVPKSFKFLGHGDCVLGDLSTPPMDQLVGGNCALFCNTNLACTGFAYSPDVGCKLYMAGPLKVSNADIGGVPGLAGTGKPSKSQCFAKVYNTPTEIQFLQREAAPVFKDLGAGVCELEGCAAKGGSVKKCSPETEMLEDPKEEACAAKCSESSDCVGYSSAEMGCFIWNSGPLEVTTRQSTEFGFRCMLKQDGEAKGETKKELTYELGTPEERTLAKAYANKWKALPWHSKACQKKHEHPFSTDQLISKTCIGEEQQKSGTAKKRNCECMVAKAHSCYVLCATKLGRETWDGCMADCYPTPSCSDMCNHATKECLEICVANYKEVVEDLKPLFADEVNISIVDFKTE